MELGFILKKIISIFIMPLSLGFLLGFLGLWFLYKDSFKKAKFLLTISFIWIFLIGYSPFSNMLLNPLESQYTTLKTIPEDVKYILLLGGDVKNRGWEALRLYHLIPNSKIITSGYEGSRDIPEAIRTAKILEQCGVPKRDIIIHPKPKDTLEEALKIKSILGDKRFILITSASHMPRAMALFKKVGLNPIPSSTNYLYNPFVGLVSFSSGSGISKTDVAWHEYIGLLWGKIRGQI